MRGGRPLPLLLAAASMAVAGMGVHVGASPIVDEDLTPKRRRVRAPAPRYKSGSPAGYRHEHKREIARRLRQQARDDHNQMVRAQLERATDSPVTHVSRRGHDLAVLA